MTIIHPDITICRIPHYKNHTKMQSLLSYNVEPENINQTLSEAYFTTVREFVIAIGADTTYEKSKANPYLLNIDRWSINLNMYFKEMFLQT